MVALGCKYLRICHLNNCATGVATQNNVLRSEYFVGLPEMVINFFRFVAEEVRTIITELITSLIRPLFRSCLNAVEFGRWRGGLRDRNGAHRTIA